MQFRTTCGVLPCLGGKRRREASCGNHVFARFYWYSQRRREKLPFMLLLAHSLIAGALAGQVPPQAVDYRGYAEVVVETTGSRDFETALSLPGRVLNCHVRPGDPLVLLMSSQERAALDVSGLSYRVSVPDAALAWDDVRQRARARRESEPLAPAAWFDDFVELDGIESYLEELRKVAPDRIFVDDIGESFEGRTIKAIRLSNGHGDTDNPAFIVLGTQHAREWLSPMVVMWFADRLAREYGSDSEVTDLLDKMDVIIVPVVNPDGYIYSWDTDRYWRKNRNNVDLNRNWDAGWGIGNGNNPMSTETY